MEEVYFDPYIQHDTSGRRKFSSDDGGIVFAEAWRCIKVYGDFTGSMADGGVSAVMSVVYFIWDRCGTPGDPWSECKGNINERGRMMIEIKNLNKAYNLGEENGCEVLKGINLTIPDGEMTAIMGASGAGKSTLLHILSCIDQYDNGEYLLDGELIGRMGDARMAEIRNEKMGIVMQDFALIEDFTALENVMMPLDFSAKKRRKKEKRNMALEALEAVSMKEYAGKPVCKLSGGQKQRVAIARGLVNRPEILFADEPTGALDSVTSGEIMKLLRTLNEKGTTMVIVTHDRLVAESCDRIIKIVDGRVQDIA